ncbi:Osteoclast-associated immunoglobulin-like receptor, partial [Galemys pyrenaicus]
SRNIQTTPVLQDSYPKPRLGVLPAAVVTPGVNVTLRCQAPQPAWRFALFKSGGIPARWNVSQEVAEFFLEEVTPAQGGSYHCCYQGLGWGHGVWSPPSDALELLVTDELPQPSLEVLPGPAGKRGADVVLRCTGSRGGMSFALYREGTVEPLLYGFSKLSWADFPLPAAQASGSYSCYYHTPSAPYVLSPRSPLLAISSHDSDYTRENLIRLGLAGLVLLSLLTLVVVDWRSREGPLLAGGPKLHRASPGRRRAQAETLQSWQAGTHTPPGAPQPAGPQRPKQ